MDAKVRLSKRVVDGALSPAAGESRLWDSEIKGLCLRLYSSGRRTYAVKYRLNGKQRWQTLGEHGSPWTPDLARARAREILHSARIGIDPSGQPAPEEPSINVAKLIGTYLTEGPVTRPSKRATAWATDRSNLNNHVLPLIGSILIDDLTPDDIARMVHGIAIGATARTERTANLRGKIIVRGGSGIAARAKASASAMFGWAVERCLMQANPATRVRLPKRKSIERYLSEKEAADLLEVIQHMESQEGANLAHLNIIRLLLYTGARRSEISQLEWSEVLLDRSQLLLPPHRTKSGSSTGERRIALNEAACKVLRGLARDHRYVFPRRDGKAPTLDVQGTWDKVRLAARLQDVRLHDLRHTFASFAVADGASLHLVAKALGHSTTRVTERYAHLSDDPVARMVENTGRRFS